MRKTLIAPLMLALLLWTAVVQGADGDAILGYWKTPDGDAQFEIYKCGPEYCGRIAQLEEPVYPPKDKDLAGLPKIDLKNPDARLRNRKLLGLTILEGFRYKGGNTWAGRIYNPEDGNTYKCRLSVAGRGERLKVRGYLGVSLLGRTQTWTRQTKDS